MRARAHTANLTRSRGIALIAGLMLMASMVLLTLAIATGVLLEGRMAGNFSDGQLALSRAQLAQRWGEDWLYSQVTNPLDPECESNCGANPIYPLGILPDSPEFENSDWWSLNARKAGIEPLTELVHMDYTLPGTDDPLWLIEELRMEPMEALIDEPDAKLGYYRVIAYGSGRLPGSVAVTESIIARPWISSLEPAPLPPDTATRFCESAAPEIDCGRMSWRRRR